VVDEEFFSNYFLPNVWFVLISSIPYDHIPFFNLVLSTNIAIKRNSMDVNDQKFLFEVFLGCQDFINWKTKDIFKNVSPNFRPENLKYIAEKIKVYDRKELKPLIDKLWKLYVKVQPSDDLKPYVHELLKEELSELPTSQKLLASLFSHHSDFKAKCNQFIFEELSSIFTYQDEPIRIHSFIKVGSWHIPMSMFSSSNINMINTFCSIASFYGVDLEVIESLKGEISSKKKHQYIEETIEKVHNAALEGRWLLICNPEILDQWRRIVRMLREMEADGRIVNSFRLIFDFQDVEYEQIPVEFLTNHSVVMYICDDNMEDMEGFNDVWANILNQDLVDLNKMIDMTMDN